MALIINSVWNNFNHRLNKSMCMNSPGEILNRFGRCTKVSATITGNNNTYNIPVFKVTGTVRVVDQYAVITSITNLTNMTNVYADVWDGTVSENLTLDGADLSGAPVGTFFTKDQDVTKAYSVNVSDQARVNEITATKEIGKPFTVTQKNGVDTYIRFNYTTNTVLDFDMDIFFYYQLMDGSNLELV